MAVVNNLAQGLARQLHTEVAVGAAHVSTKTRVEQHGRVKVYRLRVPRYPRLRWQRPLRKGLLAIAEDFEPTLVHAHSTHYYAAAALDGRWPNVITAHGVVRHEAALNDAQTLKERLAWQYDSLFEARVLQRAHTCIAITPYIRQAFAQYRHIRWHDIDNPVDDACFNVKRNPISGCILSVARVIPRKGIDTLIQAFAEIAPLFPEARLRIAGETDSAPGFVADCKNMVEERALQNQVSFLGNLQRSDLLAEYARASALVLAARQETAPVVVAEALAAGCPVVASKVGGVPYQIEHERTGLLVPPDQPHDLALALRRLLTEPKQVQTWGENAPHSAACFRLDTVVTKTLDVYDEVLI